MREGFIYIYSDHLSQETALSEKTGILYCEDKTQYSPHELQLLDDAGTGAVPLAIHRVKKVLGGKIMKIERNHNGL
jgi:hypothetical protein